MFGSATPRLSRTSNFIIAPRNNDISLSPQIWRPHHYWISYPRCPPTMAGARRSPRRRCLTASRMRRTQRATSWGAWQTGPTERIATVEDASSLAEITGVGYFIYRLSHFCSRSNLWLRPTSLWCQPGFKSLRHRSRRGGSHILCCRQQPDFCQGPWVRKGRRHCLPRTGTAWWTRRSTRRWTGNFPACRRPWRKPVRQPWRTRWTRRTPLRVERRQAAAQPRCVRPGQAGLECGGRD